MIEIPLILNSKEDYEYIRKHYAKPVWLSEYQCLLDTMYAWFNTGAIKEENEGITDATHKVVEVDNTNTKYQYERKLDENCKLLRLGYTKEEVEKIISDN